MATNWLRDIHEKEISGGGMLAGRAGKTAAVNAWLEKKRVEDPEALIVTMGLDKESGDVYEKTVLARPSDYEVVSSEIKAPILGIDYAKGEAITAYGVYDTNTGKWLRNLTEEEIKAIKNPDQ